MKNYDIKSATAELSLKQKIVVSGKRLAFLVPNMFNRIGKGFSGKIKQFKVHKEETQVEDKNTEKNAMLEEAKAQVSAVNYEKAASIEEKIQNKEEKVVEVKQNENISDNVKNYIIKAYESDIDNLREKQARVSSSPRRLLISKIFLQKLIANRKSKIIKNRQDKKIDKELKKAESREVSSIDDAKLKYVALNNKRMQLMEQMKKTQNEIKEIQESMMSLVNDYSLTKDMFEETEEKTK